MSEEIVATSNEGMVSPATAWSCTIGVAMFIGGAATSFIAKIVGAEGLIVRAPGVTAIIGFATTAAAILAHEGQSKPVEERVSPAIAWGCSAGATMFFGGLIGWAAGGEAISTGIAAFGLALTASCITMHEDKHPDRPSHDVEQHPPSLNV